VHWRGIQLLSFRVWILSRVGKDQGILLSNTFAASFPDAIVVYDAAGRVASVTENGITETYTRDALRRVRTIDAVTRTVI